MLDEAGLPFMHSIAALMNGVLLPLLEVAVLDRAESVLRRLDAVELVVEGDIVDPVIRPDAAQAGCVQMDAGAAGALTEIGVDLQVAEDGAVQRGADVEDIAGQIVGHDLRAVAIQHRAGSSARSVADQAYRPRDAHTCAIEAILSRVDLGGSSERRDGQRVEEFARGVLACQHAARAVVLGVDNLSELVGIRLSDTTRTASRVIANILEVLIKRAAGNRSVWLLTEGIGRSWHRSHLSIA